MGRVRACASYALHSIYVSGGAAPRRARPTPPCAGEMIVWDLGTVRETRTRNGDEKLAKEEGCKSRVLNSLTTICSVMWTTKTKVNYALAPHWTTHTHTGESLLTRLARRLWAAKLRSKPQAGGASGPHAPARAAALPPAPAVSLALPYTESPGS